MASNLFRNPVHLGLGARAVAEPEFTNMNWYAAYEKRHGGDGAEGRLVSMYTFDESWDSWEMHRDQRAGRVAHRRRYGRGHGGVHHFGPRHGAPRALSLRR
jgi:hypothetical protein